MGEGLGVGVEKPSDGEEPPPYDEVPPPADVVPPPADVVPPPDDVPPSDDAVPPPSVGEVLPSDGEMPPWAGDVPSADAVTLALGEYGSASGACESTGSGSFERDSDAFGAVRDRGPWRFPSPGRSGADGPSGLEVSHAVGAWAWGEDAGTAAGWPAMPWTTLPELGTPVSS